MKITAGLPFKHIFSFDDYSADGGYVLTGKISDAEGSYDLAAGDFDGDGTDWTLYLDDTTTTGYAAGDCVLYIMAALDGVSEVIYQAPIKIEALGTVSHARKMVTAIEALMEGRTDKAYESMVTPDGEQITRLDPDKLQKWLAYYKRALAKETRRGSGSPGHRRFLTRFN